MQYFYLSALIFSLASLAFADKKFELVLFPAYRTAAKILASGIIFFLIWDIAGISLEVFSTNRKWVSGIYFFTPDLPLEELLFLALLCYMTLISWRVVCSRTF